jgi:hypothetical protein
MFICWDNTGLNYSRSKTVSDRQEISSLNGTNNGEDKLPLNFAVVVDQLLPGSLQPQRTLISLNSMNKLITNSEK